MKLSGSLVLVFTSLSSLVAWSSARKITVVSDTLKSEADALTTPDQQKVYPAHTWMLFEADGADPALRVELVATDHGLAVSATSYTSTGGDNGRVDSPLVAANTERRSAVLETTAAITNQRIFNDSLATGQSLLVDLLRANGFGELVYSMTNGHMSTSADLVLSMLLNSNLRVSPASVINNLYPVVIVGEKWSALQRQTVGKSRAPYPSINYLISGQLPHNAPASTQRYPPVPEVFFFDPANGFQPKKLDDGTWLQVSTDPRLTSNVPSAPRQQQQQQQPATTSRCSNPSDLSLQELAVCQAAARGAAANGLPPLERSASPVLPQ